MDRSPVTPGPSAPPGAGRRLLAGLISPGGVRAPFGLAAATGVLIVVALAVHQGLPQVVSVLTGAGWGLALVCLLHVPALFCSSAAWQLMTRPVWRGGMRSFLQARWIREGVNTLLPVAQVGGDVVGARILTFHAMPASLAGASLVVDLTLEVLAQFAITIIGLVLLLGSGDSHGTGRAIGLGLAGAVPLLLGFLLAQRWGLFRLLERLLQRVAEKHPALGLGRMDGLHDAIQGLYRWPSGLAAGGGLHLLSWALTATQVWMALRLMGHPLPFWKAFVLFSLGHAVRSAAFLVPSGWGVQEASLVLLGGMYGLPAPVGLAVSLAIRLREIALGAPALLWWPFLEARRDLSAAPAASASGVPRT